MEAILRRRAFGKVWFPITTEKNSELMAWLFSKGYAANADRMTMDECKALTGTFNGFAPNTSFNLTPFIKTLWVADSHVDEYKAHTRWSLCDVQPISEYQWINQEVGNFILGGGKWLIFILLGGCSAERSAA